MKRSVAALRGREYGGALRQRLEPRAGGLCNTLTRVQKDNMVMGIEKLGNFMGHTGGNFAGMVYNPSGISPAISSMTGGGRQPHIPVASTAEGNDLEMAVYSVNGKRYKIRLRKLTPRECWRLMGISDRDYDKAASVVSPTQLYKQAGNGIVVDVMAALFGKVFEALGREASINET